MGLLRVQLLALFGAFFIDHAAASLTLDLRLSDGTKQVGNLTVNQVILFDLFAVVVGEAGNSASEGVRDAYVTILSDHGGNIRGDLSASLPTGFSTTGSSRGISSDLDGDGDQDLGSLGTVKSTSFLFPKATTMQITAGFAIPNGKEFKLATVFFHVTSILNASDPTATYLSVYVPNFTNPTEIEAHWQEDGVVSNDAGLTPGGTFPNSFPVAGPAVALYSVPEPSVFTFLGGAALLACARRARRR